MFFKNYQNNTLVVQVGPPKQSDPSINSGREVKCESGSLHFVLLRFHSHSRSSVRITFYNSHSVTSFKSFSKFDNSDLWTTKTE